MTHRHQFVRACDVEKPRPNATSIHSTLMGGVFVCIDPECDATRHVWSDGSKTIVKEGIRS